MAEWGQVQTDTLLSTSSTLDTRETGREGFGKARASTPASPQVAGGGLQYSFVTGGKYEGEYLADLKHGQGKYTFTNGDW